MKSNTLKLAIRMLLVPVVVSFWSCESVIEPIEQTLITPDQQNPAAYGRYMEALKNYKNSEHYVVCARFDNAPAHPISEQHSLRSMPDSLDFVILSDALSTFDREDLASVQRKSTRVLATADCTDATMAAKNLDAAIASLATDGLDGLSIVYHGFIDTGAASLWSSLATKLSGVHGKLLLFEGNPMFVAKADRAKFNYFVLDVTHLANIATVRSEVDYTTNYIGIDASKLLLTVTPTGTISDDLQRNQPAYVEIAKCIKASKPLAGMAVFNISEDYYDARANYRRTKAAIRLLNPVS